jgi:hypothetical protein
LIHCFSDVCFFDVAHRFHPRFLMI